jgi:isoleucyl-tRNA synthetase
MDAVRRLASLGRAARESAGIRVRQPLARMQVAIPPGVAGPGFDALLGLLAAETNVKAIELVASDTELVRLRGKANFRTLGRKYGADMQAVAAWVAGLDAATLRRLERGETITGAWTLEPDDVTIAREVTTDWPVESHGPYVVALDPALTPALRREGLARELVNRVQRLRKEAGYEVSTRVRLAIQGDATVLEAAREHAEYLAGETLATELAIGAAMADADRIESVTIDDHAAALAVRRAGNGRTDSGPAQADGT